VGERWVMADPGVGNCVEACMASIMEHDGSLPYFGRQPNWFALAQKWCWTQHWLAVWHDQARMAGYVPEGYAIACGRSLREDGSIGGHHAVVVNDGELIHDPRGEDAPGLCAVVGFIIMVQYVYRGPTGMVGRAGKLV
jgi:hypothetical protein